MTARQECEVVSESRAEPVVMVYRYVSWIFILGTNIHRGFYVC